jgi:hypothetical protein
MDDFAASATHDNDIITIFFEVTSLINSVHLPMYKWATNSTHLQDISRTQGLPLQTETQVLGMDPRSTLTTRALQGIAGTTSNKAPSTTSHVEILRLTRIVFASGTRGKNHFPGYMD